MAFLELTDIHKTYEGAPLLCGVSFEVERGSLACLLGPSGSGKTTLLRIIAGLEMPASGRVRVEAEDVTDTPIHRRGVVLMFQDYALFPHRTVWENIAFGLRMQRRSRSDVAARVADMVELLHLEGLERRSVVDLSGGERQRVALARSLAPKPRLLLLDEPLGALDRNLRERLLEELPGVLAEVGVTALMVTHDQEEAFAMADHVILLHDGKVAQAGTPQAVYEAPATVWVARFLGLRNLLPAIALDGERAQTPIGTFTLQPQTLRPAAMARGTLLVQPWGIHLDCPPGALNRFQGHIARRTFRGKHSSLAIAVGETTLTLDISRNHAGMDIGAQLEGYLDPAALRWLPEPVDTDSACME